MELFDFEEKLTLSREDAAARLVAIADSLARHNQLEFKREGIPYTVDVADQVEMEIEIEVGSDGNSLEIEINW